MLEVKGYQLKYKKHIEELNADGYILTHEKTGASVCVLECDDENKVFNIGFCTPPTNDCGVPHIIEHSVLCGSKKYPAKDPFVELAKGSLNTFLNAMTYPEKTIYPVASCNDADFKNLMAVYMDAVFYPNIYRNKKIFEQEGWHYELESVDGELTYNGVVFNEMKGAFSQADGVLDRYTRHELFPDTPYGFESGGDPQAIPELTYEQFLEFHSKYYHPSNAYIYLYGKMDMAAQLEWIDEEYLSHFEKEDYDMSQLINDQTAFDQMRDVTIEYGISEEEDEAEGAYLSWNKVTGSTLDTYEMTAMQILEYVLLGSSGAILRTALSQKGIGQDVYGGIEVGTKQSYLSVIAKGASLEQKEEFVSTIEETLQTLVKEGISKKSLMAGIVAQEFRNREADFGRYPKGLILGLNMLETWIYDENKAFDRLEYNQIYEGLKAAVETDYFEKLIEEKLLHAKHGVVLCAKPVKGLTEQKEAEIAKKLAAYKETLSTEELMAIVENTKALKAYQEEPTPKEDLESIPMIHISDIKKEASKIVWEEKEVTDSVTYVHHDVFTSGIVYLRLAFDTSFIPMEDYSYFSAFASCFGMLDTKHFTYEEIPDEVNILTGGISYAIANYNRIDEPREQKNRMSHSRFEVKVKVFESNLDDAMELLKEIFTTTNFDQTDRILELLKRNYARLEQKLQSSGHSVAVNRAFSYHDLVSYLTEKTSGIDFYHFLGNLIEHFEEEKDALVARFKQYAVDVLRKENLIVDVTADEEGYKATRESVNQLLAILGEQKLMPAMMEFVEESANEAFTSSMQVSFSAQCGNFKNAGFDYTGAMRVLTVSLDYDYLWTKIRVQGGAYGCMVGFGVDGETYFASYRDPEVAKTYEVYETLPEYLEHFDADEMEMEKNIIGAIAELDIPKTPTMIGSAGFNAYMAGITDEMKQKERDEILNCTADSIRALAKPVAAALACNSICTVGNLGKIEASKDRFKKILPLL